MKKLSSYVLIVVITLGMSLTSQARESQRKGKSVQGLQKTAEVVNGSFDGNRCNARGQNTGQYVSHVLTNTAAFEWPKGTNKFIDYAAGVWIIGKVGSEFRTANAEYSVETAPGVILPNGQPDDPTLPKYKFYKISKADISNPGDDYLNWPVDQGAPVDENGQPALIGDQMLWYVYNDADPAPHANLFGTQPMGVEVQITIWGYNRVDAFGDMFFVKAKIINKSSNSYDSTFIGLWDDPDNGDAASDYVGCDTTLSLGYDWNSDNNDATYGAGGPAIGRDYFQGPIVPSPGDTALVSGRKVPDYKNLPMYAFAFYWNGATYPHRDPETAQEVFNYMTGRLQDGSPFINPETNQPTRFVFPGDPETGTGWTEISPTTEAPGDRRFLMSCGPFTFAPGDTQEVVFGVLIAAGSDNRNSVTVLKQVDQVAQLAYDLNFALPATPPTPSVTKAELDQEIALYWDGAAESYDVEDLIDRDPDGNPTRYTFEGYIVYQLNALSGATQTKRLGVFDLNDGVTDIKDQVFDNTRGELLNVTVVKGNDGGASRFFRTTLDAFTGVRLVNGHPYYFAVTAYGYNPYGIPKMYEGPLEVFTVTPHAPPPGARYVAVYGDTLQSVHTGPSDGGAFGLVADPSKVTGDDYKVVFRVDAEGTSVWDVVDATTNTVKLSGQTNQSGDNAYSVVDGVQVKVTGPSLNFKNFQHVAGPSGPIDPPTYAAFAFNGSGFPTLDGLDVNAGVNDRPVDDWGGGLWGVHTADNGSRASYASFVDRVTNGGNNWKNIIPYDWEIRFTADGGYAYDPFVTGKVFHVPFELWRIGIATPNDPSDDVRFVPYVLDDDESGTFNLCQTHPNAGADEHTISGGDNDPYTDWIYWATPDNEAPGDAGYKAWEAAALAIPGLQDDGSFYGELATDNTMRRMVLVNFNGGSISDPTWPANLTSQMPATGNVIRILSTKPSSPADVFAYTTAGIGVTQSTDLAKTDINMINVFPNPYFAAQSVERNPINRFVTFSHLPVNAKTTIRIFTLAGALVRTIDHTPGSTFERWDLRNSSGIPVASAMYLVHIEMEGLGTKILKLAIIQPEERLDRL
jgi:hypothetical protein